MAQSAATKPAVAAAAVDAKAFVSTVANSNKFEIESSRVALQKSKREDVKRFAQMMIDDHTKAEQEFVQAVKAANEQLPDTSKLDAQHEATLNRVNAATNFDKDYIAAQLKAHTDAVALFKTYSMSGESAPLKQFAAKLLPDLQKHLDAVQKLSTSNTTGAKAHKATKAKG
nr:DUF4142 domain-containing protein [Alsobacter ponti]